MFTKKKEKSFHQKSDQDSQYIFRNSQQIAKEFLNKLKNSHIELSGIFKFQKCTTKYIRNPI